MLTHKDLRQTKCIILYNADYFWLKYYKLDIITINQGYDFLCKDAEGYSKYHMYTGFFVSH